METMTIDHNGLTYANVTVDEALAAGVPQSVIDDAIAAIRREAIKAECRRRIYGTASAEAQMNINGAAALVAGKAASERTEEETVLLAAQALAVQWITDMRAAVETLSADADADYLADVSWPECPDTVITLAARY